MSSILTVKIDAYKYVTNNIRKCKFNTDEINQ